MAKQTTIDFSAVTAAKGNNTSLSEIWYKDVKESSSLARLLWSDPSIVTCNVTLTFTSWYIADKDVETTHTWTIPANYTWKDLLDSTSKNSYTDSQLGVCQFITSGEDSSSGNVVLSVATTSQYWLACTVSNSNLDAGTKYMITKSVNTQTKTYTYGGVYSSGEEVRKIDSTDITDSIESSVYYESADLTTETTLDYIDPYSKIIDPRISTNIPEGSESNWVLKSSTDYEDSQPDGTAIYSVDIYTRTVISYAVSYLPGYEKATPKYYLVKRTKDDSEEAVYTKLVLGDNTITIKADEPNFYLFCDSDATYTFTASSSNAYLGYEEKTQYDDTEYWETTWVDGTSFSLNAKENEVLYICCSNLDFSDETYTLTITKN